MPRTRSIKPEFWSDEKISKISLQARLLYIGMWGTSDDSGTTKGHPVWLKSQIFPYDDFSIKQFETWLNELIKMDRILPYEVSGEKYFYIPGFNKHQKIQHPSPAKNPPPPESLMSGSRMAHEQTETETETETEGNSGIILSSQRLDLPPFEEIIKYLNFKTGKNFSFKTKTNQKTIKARWKEGKRFNDFKKVIDIKFSKWATDEKMMDFLRPETLFGPKMDSYLNEKVEADPYKDFQVLGGKEGKNNYSG